MELCTTNYLPINEFVLQIKFRNFSLSFSLSFSACTNLCLCEWVTHSSKKKISIPVNIWFQKISVCFWFLSKKFKPANKVVCIVSKSVNLQSSCCETIVLLTQSVRFFTYCVTWITMRWFRWQRRRKVIFKMYNLYSQRNSYLNKRFFFVRKV